MSLSLETCQGHLDAVYGMYGSQLPKWNCGELARMCVVCTGINHLKGFGINCVSICIVLVVTFSPNICLPV